MKVHRLLFCLQVIIWGQCDLPVITEGNGLDSIKPCSTVLDAGDSVTAVGISRVLTPDGRYFWFSVMSFCV